MIDVLNDGISSVHLVEITGTDKSLVDAARVSYGKDDIDAPFTLKDAKLVRRLLTDNHGSVMEHTMIKYRMTMPIFLTRQVQRHRHSSFNEMSARYTEVDENLFYVPPVVRAQAKVNKQASAAANELEVPGGFPSVQMWTLSAQEDFRRSWEQSYNTYQRLLAKGVAREQARGVLPVGQYTSFYMTVNLRSLLHFCSLRLHEGAQWEIQKYARAMLSLAKVNFPVTVAVFMDMNPEIFPVEETTFYTQAIKSLR